MVSRTVLKRKKGITLVALIITVILMLILAGVTISVLTEHGGVFGKTKSSAELYERATENENKTITNIMNTVDKYLNGLGIEDDKDDNPKVKPQATIGALITSNQTYDGRLNGSYNNPIIPKGFAPINENGANWGTEDGYKYGLVITDEITSGESTGNEFVWIPVDGTTVTFGRYNWGCNYHSYSNYSETTPSFLDTTNSESSINKNQGFYIARFEAGIADNMTELTANSTTTYGDGTYKPVSKQGATVWNYIQWGINNSNETPGNGAVTIARSMYPDVSADYGVTSTLIYASQWDTALKFIQAYDIGEVGYSTYATNSAGYGNYSSGDSITNTSKPATCGKLEIFRQKNIYDMGGNAEEWTMEADGSSRRTTRGGIYSQSGSSRPAAFRHYAGDSWNVCYPHCSFRVALYIKY